MSTITIPNTVPSPREDAALLHRAIKGIVCDTATVINVLAHRDAEQRESILSEYETMFSEDISRRISSHVRGHLKKAILLWMPDPNTRDATIVRHALTGTLTDFKAVTEVICSRTSSQLRHLKQVYTTKFRSCVERDIESLATGDYKRLILAYLRTSRYEGPEIDAMMVKEDTDALCKFEDKTLADIFTDRSRAHLLAVSAAYQNTFSKSLEKAIKRKTSGSFEYGLLTILRCAENPAKYFAKVCFKAMKGLGTDDPTLIRAVVSRAEIDMQDIKVEYKKMFGRTLNHAVSSDTSGHYRDFLLSLLGRPNY